jgi:predicted RNA binding protein YcfA (HicA-like mRNA interferase family)
MSRKEKRLAKMRSNPKGDWKIEDFKGLAEQYGMEWRQPGTSHVTFVVPNGNALTVPAHKPIKPVYVKKCLALLSELEVDDNENTTA